MSCRLACGCAELAEVEGALGVGVDPEAFIGRLPGLPVLWCAGVPAEELAAAEGAAVSVDSNRRGGSAVSGAGAAVSCNGRCVAVVAAVPADGGVATPICCAGVEASAEPDTLMLR